MFITSVVIAKSGIQFGTSGARGLVNQLTPQVCAAFTHAFLVSLQGQFKFQQVAVAIDNRPSSPSIAQTCIAAIESVGLEAIYYGVVPTPALAFAAMQQSIPCIMVTGSHIPFDRNGLKFYRPDGEITKADEQAILTAKVEFALPQELPSLLINTRAAQLYIERYTALFEKDLLANKRIGIYEHSSAGRDLYLPLFSALGAEVVVLERSDEFVPIDTEAVSEEDKVKARVWSQQYQLDAIFSTDGDGDRPLVADENGEWLRGDILGLLCAQAMNMQALAVPLSCNTVIESIPQFSQISRTRIGSPYVIAELAALEKHYHAISGFEANGGYLLGSDVKINGKSLRALPTRDAVLPFIMLLSAAKETGIAALVEALPKRYTHSDRIQNFATEKSVAIVQAGTQNPQALSDRVGFAGLTVDAVDTTDGLRITLSNNSIFHLRPSGNAPELRCYAEAGSYEQAQTIVNQVLEKVQQL
ncbi:phosphomannomutase [Vibrio cholerae]|uniref:phosphomannomutase n=1 Tax=Vibrio cholerae TaxID=666 RepID=UPI0011DB8FA7|nr:phosphomannomutase [Vibrio cholerae]EGR2537670.1 phosphomannomutase [Vibrio cholerae]EJL6293314.1 phosphomannomutase [Vibrio cholerae]TXZ65734.1 phosphomannomutase [Vibrio cholerae]GIB36597.1 Phosphomannomutase [Vibrio cholerae]